MRIRCVAFDLDDTLWACKPVIERAEQHFYDWLAEHYPRITEAFSAGELVQNRVFFMQQRPELHYNLTRLRKDWIASLARQHDYPLEMVETGFEVFWLARNEVQFFAGALEVLERLADRFITGVISNGNASVRHIGVGHLFDFVHSAAEAGVAKPDPAIFAQALQKAGVAAHEAVYVGDDPIRDIQGAANAGWRTIWFNPAQDEWVGGQPPDVTISDLTELETVIQRL